MLTIALIDRLFSQERFGQLLTQLSRNQLLLPGPVKSRLEEAPAGIIALGLHRVLDQSFAPAPSVTGKAMLSYIIDHQSAQGDFHHCPLATAAVIGVINHWCRDFSRKSTLPADQQSHLQAVKQMAIEALAGMRSQEDALFSHPYDQSRRDRQLTTAIVLFFLGSDEDASVALALPQLRAALASGPLSPEAHQALAMARPIPSKHAA